MVLGILGVGYWGKNILRVLYNLKGEFGFEILASDIDEKVIEERKKEFKVEFTRNPEDILKSKEVKAVLIATPAETHYELSKIALLEGKDVFVEKPLALRFEKGRELVEISDRENRVLMVGHILLYHPALQKLKDIVSSGEIGKIEYIYSNRLNIGKLRTEENVLWSFAPHDISSILWIANEEPQKVFAVGGDFLQRGIWDVTLTVLEFRQIIAHIFVSWLHPFKEQKLVVVCSKGMLVFDDMSEQKLFLYPHKIEWKEGKIPVAEKAEKIPIKVEMEEPLKLEIKHFIECILERKRPRTDAREGLRVLKILSLAERSIREGRKIEVVKDEEKRGNFFVDSSSFFVHPSSFVDEDVEIGEGTKIWHFCHISRGARIGRGCVIGQNVFIGKGVKIGDRVKIQNNVSVYEGVEIEDEVFLGPSMVFTNVINPRAFIERKNEFRRTLVRRGATIGANATIICGVEIGRFAFVGAGAVVTHSVRDHALVVGVPARQVGWVCICGTKLDFKDKRSICKCGSEFEIEDGKISAIFLNFPPRK